MRLDAEEYINVRRRKSGNGGAHLYIPETVLCKALANAGIDCNEVYLKAKAFAAKDGKRAQIMVRISRGDARKFTRPKGVKEVKWLSKG